MARPANKKLKKDIKAAKEAGASIEELCETFGLSRNTIFYHLRTDQDGRMRYTDEQRRKLASLSSEELRVVAARTGRSLLALQRVASREKKRRREEARTRIILDDYLSFAEPSHLRLFGFDQSHLVLAERLLSTYGLALKAPNVLTHVPSGRWQELNLAEQESLLLDSGAFLRNEAPTLKERWREKGK